MINSPLNVVLFCHSLISDWNHGNAHFLRGIATELLASGHTLRVFEPADAWSVENLVSAEGPAAIDDFHTAYPGLSSSRYRADDLDLDAALDDADLVIVHEWNDHQIVERIGRHRGGGGRYVLLFHDTHHRSVSDEASVAGYDLQHYDGVLAFGEVIRERYIRHGWARQAWTWHEAADVRMFRPFRPASARGPEADFTGDVVWIGNWGDDERSAEIRDYLVAPVRDLALRARVYGVRYPPEARAALAGAGIEYRGWLPNYVVPQVFGRFRATLHIPRAPYVRALPGVPTIRVFEALACGIPLLSCWWQDTEGLFTPGSDFLMVRTPDDMRAALRLVMNDAAAAAALAAAGRQTILARHTCAHRVAELLQIVTTIRGAPGDVAVNA